MKLQQVLEQLFNVKLVQVDAQGQTFRVEGDASRPRLEEMIAAKKLEWQDPVDPTCGNDDNTDYVYVSPDNSDDWGELFVAFDRNDGLMYVS